MSEHATRRSLRRSGRGFFAVAIWQPKREVNVGGLLRSAFLYGAAAVFTIGSRYRRQASDTPDLAKHVPLMHMADLDDLIEHLPYGCPLVGVEMDASARQLSRYVHPLKATYLFGAEDHGLPASVMKRCHELLEIESAMPHSLNVACAGSIVMHDRHAKEVSHVG